MEFLTNLWLPILLSSVFVFIASSIIHVVLHWHKSDYGRLPGEDGILAEMRDQGVQPGFYYFPGCNDMKDMKNPEVIRKYDEGPVGFLTVLPDGVPGMSANLVQWFLFTLVIGIFTGYIGWLGLGAGADYRLVFRLTGAVSVLAYAITYIPDSIWKGLSWKITLKNMVDGVIYGLLTAGTFGWLWPEA